MEINEKKKMQKKVERKLEGKVAKPVVWLEPNTSWLIGVHSAAVLQPTKTLDTMTDT